MRMNPPDRRLVPLKGLTRKRFSEDVFRAALKRLDDRQIVLRHIGDMHQTVIRYRGTNNHSYDVMVVRDADGRVLIDNPTDFLIENGRTPTSEANAFWKRVRAAFDVAL